MSLRFPPDVPGPSRPPRRRALVFGACVLLTVLAVVVLLVATNGLRLPRGPGLVPLPSIGSSAGDGDLGGTSVGVDADVAAVSRLEPALLAAVRQAAAAAADDDIELRVTSGWRSPEFQQRLLDHAVARYGSLAEARRWVETPQGSRHVFGDAVDIGPTDAVYWMSEHGSDFGLCQTYANEIWHYELATTPGGKCPAMRPDGSG